MATYVHTTPSPAKIRVALVIESGKLRPVWFEETDRKAGERVFIKQVTYVWDHLEGAARIMNFAVWDGTNSYQLSLNVRDFTWTLGIAEDAGHPWRR